MNTYDGLTLPEGFNREGVIKSINWLAERTAKEGVERALVLNKDGRCVWSSIGNDGSVVAGPDSLMHKAQAFLMLHSHPTPAELSNTDLGAARAFDCNALMAVSRDGSVSWSHGMHRDINPLVWMFMEQGLLSQFKDKPDDMRAIETGEFRDSQVARMNHQAMEYFNNKIHALQDYFVWYGPEMKDLLKQEGITV